MARWMVAAILAAWWTAALGEEVPAVLQWSQRVELSTRVSGIVREVRVDAGQRVSKGQPMLTLDDRVYQARVSEARAAVAKRREELADARRDLGRTQELYDRTVIATSELDQAKLREARTRAQLAEARARLAQEGKDLEDTVLRAPFDGVVVARRAEPGENVVVGLQPQPLIIFARAGEMVARLQLSESQITRLKPGQAVTVVVGGQAYPGVLKSLGLEPLAGRDRVVYPAEVVFGVKELLRAGMGATVRLP
jgi:RND family efflux transporter MFP subunit